MYISTKHTFQTMFFWLIVIVDYDSGGGNNNHKDDDYDATSMALPWRSSIQQHQWNKVKYYNNPNLLRRQQERA